MIRNEPGRKRETRPKPGSDVQSRVRRYSSRSFAILQFVRTAQPELTFLYLLATGRAPQDSLRDYLSAKATERSYGKWEMAAMGAHTRLAVTAYQLAAPAVERIAVLFSRLIEGTAVHEAYEQAYRASLALEEAAKDERMAFSEVAKWLRYGAYPLSPSSYGRCDMRRGAQRSIER